MTDSQVGLLSIAIGIWLAVPGILSLGITLLQLLVPAVATGQKGAIRLGWTAVVATSAWLLIGVAMTSQVPATSDVAEPYAARWATTWANTMGVVLGREAEAQDLAQRLDPQLETVVGRQAASFLAQHSLDLGVAENASIALDARTGGSLATEQVLRRLGPLSSAEAVEGTAAHLQEAALEPAMREWLLELFRSAWASAHPDPAEQLDFDLALAAYTSAAGERVLTTVNTTVVEGTPAAAAALANRVSAAHLEPEQANRAANLYAGQDERLGAEGLAPALQIARTPPLLNNLAVRPEVCSLTKLELLREAHALSDHPTIAKNLAYWDSRVTHGDRHGC